MEILQLNFSVRKKEKHKTGGNTETLLLAYKDMQMLAKTSMRQEDSKNYVDKWKYSQRQVINVTCWDITSHKCRDIELERHKLKSEKHLKL